MAKSGTSGSNRNLNYRYSGTSYYNCLYRGSSTSAYGDASNTSYGYNRTTSRPNAQFNIDAKVPNYGTDVVAKVSATPMDKFMFRYWLKNDETTPYSREKSFYYDLSEEGVTFTGVFEWNPDLPGEPAEIEKALRYNINVAVSEEEAGIVSGAGYYAYGKSITISTSENAGYTFLKWTKNGEDYDTSKSLSFTVGTEDVDFVAVYEKIPVPPVPDSHKLYLKPSSSGCCTFNLANGIEVEEGEAFTVTATLAPEQVFKGWYDEKGNLLAETLSYGTHMGTEDITLIAVCEYTPASPADPNNDLGYVPIAPEKEKTGDVNGDGKVNVADAIEIIDVYLTAREIDTPDRKYDVNNDGKVNVADAIEVINMYLTAE